jgi:DNA polymerase
MGGPRLVSYAEDNFGITLTPERAQEMIDGYRDTNRPVVELWYESQKCAMEAVQRKGVMIPQGRLQWRFKGRFLQCRLPSGRKISYLDPKIEIKMMPWKKKGKQITYMGVDTYTRQWKRTSTYGGKLVENYVQAICRDLMAEAMVRAANRGYPAILTVHDEVVAEVPEGFGSVEEFNGILSEQPTWADGFPIVAEGWRSKRYRK